MEPPGECYECSNLRVALHTIRIAHSNLKAITETNEFDRSIWNHLEGWLEREIDTRNSSSDRDLIFSVGPLQEVLDKMNALSGPKEDEAIE